MLFNIGNIYDYCSVCCLVLSHRETQDYISVFVFTVSPLVVCYEAWSMTLKATWSICGFLFLLQNHVIQYKLYLL